MTEDQYILGIEGSSTDVGTPVSLSEVGLLQSGRVPAWVATQPALVGEGVLLITDDADAWGAGSLAGEPSTKGVLLGLSRDGRPVVVEVCQTPASSGMVSQAIVYAAAVAALTPAQLATAYLEHHRANPSGPRNLQDALDVVYGHAPSLSPQTLAAPRVRQIAWSFPRGSDTTVRWLAAHDIEIALVQVQPYRVGGQHVAVVTSVYDPEAARPEVLGSGRAPSGTPANPVVGEVVETPPPPSVVDSPAHEVRPEPSWTPAAQDARPEPSWTPAAPEPRPAPERAPEPQPTSQPGTAPEPRTEAPSPYPVPTPRPADPSGGDHPAERDTPPSETTSPGYPTYAPTQDRPAAQGPAGATSHTYSSSTGMPETPTVDPAPRRAGEYALSTPPGDDPVAMTEQFLARISAPFTPSERHDPATIPGLSRPSHSEGGDPPPRYVDLGYA